MGNLVRTLYLWYRDTFAEHTSHRLIPVDLTAVLLVHLVLTRILRRLLGDRFVYPTDMLVVKLALTVSYYILWLGGGQVFWGASYGCSLAIVLGFLILVRCLNAGLRTRNRLTVLVELLFVLVEYWAIILLRKVDFWFFFESWGAR